MTKGIDMQPQLAEQVRSFVVATFLWDRPDRLRDEDSFLEQGIMDSTGVLELISWIEESAHSSAICGSPPAPRPWSLYLPIRSVLSASLP